MLKNYDVLERLVLSTTQKYLGREDERIREKIYSLDPKFRLSSCYQFPLYYFDLL